MCEKLISELYKDFKAWLKKQPLWLKILAIAAIIIGLLCYFFREEIKSQIIDFCKEHKECIPKLHYIPITMVFSVNDTVIGRNGIICRANDKISLIIDLRDECYFSVFGIDRNSQYPIGSLSTGTKEYNPQMGKISQSFTLDSVKGNEIFYIVARECPFSFSAEILPVLKSKYPFIESESNKKGDVEETYLLNLDSTFNQSYVFIQHE